MSALPTATVAPVERALSIAPAGPSDAESRGGLRSLRAAGVERDEAVARLHGLLLRAARFEVGRRRAALPHLRGGDLDDVANQAADDALVSVLRRLDDFRGASRFTTWAYKFAIYESAVKLRKPEGWNPLPSAGLTPETQAEQSELVDAVRHAVDTALTPHQRRVLVALALNEVPIDVLAERLNTSRGALYKTLHDARRKLRCELEERGLALVDILEDR